MQSTPLSCPRPPLTIPRAAELSAAALCSAFLAGCGGGTSEQPGSAVVADAVGSAASMPAPVATSETDASAQRRRAPAPTPAPAPAPAPSPVAGPTCGLADFNVAALARINQWRASGADCHSAGKFAPTTALVWNDKLTAAAAGHSADMAAKNYFSHTSLDGRSMADRVNATGYPWSALGENIAAGYPGINEVVDGWIASDGHCSNLMNPNYRDMGMACYPGTSTSTYRTYWTLDLGKPQ